MMQTTEAAYAKINLCLDVTARRADGYHEIDGVMQAVSLCDTLTVSYTPGGAAAVSLDAGQTPGLPAGPENLAARAAARFLEAAGLGGEVRIALEKRIPLAAGLAGGSADAAAVLRALNRLTDFALTAGELRALGLTLGADVPFCLSGGCRRTRGVGERLEPCPPMPACSLVLARRGEGISTPWAYAQLDACYGGFAPGVPRPDAGLPALLASLRAGDLPGVCRGLYNLFEPLAVSRLPDVGLLREALLSHGALAARMSGSGPTVYGVFGDGAAAIAACDALRAQGAAAFVCRPQAEIPLYSYAVHE